MKHVALFVLLATLGAGLAGCNTMNGLGKDIKEGGEAIEKAANKR